jgi:ParB family transcriptional regulator, chromosome partitioning protein
MWRRAALCCATSSPRIAVDIDVALLDPLVTAKLGREADRLREAEGWKWSEAVLIFRTPMACAACIRIRWSFSCEDQAALDAAS